MHSDPLYGTASTEISPAAVVGRRKFLGRLSLLLSLCGSALVGVPIVGFLLSPLIERVPRIWRAVGAVDSFVVGTTVEVAFADASSLPWAGVTGRTAAWLRRESEHEFIAFSINCTHLGCPVRWLSEADLFMCPCHGGVYYRDGQVASGPPPRPLARYPVRVRAGQVEIEASPAPIT
jgi:menaquinol-cytochrome c reductase iron-sulfur subunit